MKNRKKRKKNLFFPCFSVISPFRKEKKEENSFFSCFLAVPPFFTVRAECKEFPHLFFYSDIDRIVFCAIINCGSYPRGSAACHEKN